MPKSLVAGRSAVMPVEGLWLLRECRLCSCSLSSMVSIELFNHLFFLKLSLEFWCFDPHLIQTACSVSVTSTTKTHSAEWTSETISWPFFLMWNLITSAKSPGPGCCHLHITQKVMKRILIPWCDTRMKGSGSIFKHGHYWKRLCKLEFY